MEKGYIAFAIILIFALGLVIPAAVSAKPRGKSAPQCNDNIDNDGDGYIDYPNDPGCNKKGDKTETNPAIECDDGTDNDGDGLIDMADSGCSSPTDTDETNCGDSVCEGGEVCDVCVTDCGHCDSCSDTDGGNLPFTFGTASGYLNDVFYSDYDYCVDSSNIMEYYCSGDYEQSQQQSCGTDAYGSEYCIADGIYKDLTDYFCASGACDSSVTPELQQNCSDSDGYGPNYCAADIVKRDYNDYFCSIGACDFTATPETVEDCDASDGYGSPYCTGNSVFKDFNNYFCTGGACDFIPTPELQEDCDDNDGYGDAYCIADFVYQNYTDSVCSAGACDNNNVTPEIQENCDLYDDYSNNYCSSGDVYKNFNDYFCALGSCVNITTPQLVEECDWGCTSGTCDQHPDTCSDTDGGFVVNMTGTVSGVLNENPYNYTDFCNATSYVMEYYCIGNYQQIAIGNCQGNTTCSNGRCA